MANGQTILVLGATGIVGEPVARRLRQDGFAVRLLTRDVAWARAKFGPEVECLAGEVGDRISLERALDGCAGVHVSLNGGSQRAAMERVELRQQRQGQSDRGAAGHGRQPEGVDNG
jgi:uncharacterized protein YbjT (DUF2867 family)